MEAIKLCAKCVGHILARVWVSGLEDVVWCVGGGRSRWEQ